MRVALVKAPMLIMLNGLNTALSRSQAERPPQWMSAGVLCVVCFLRVLGRAVQVLKFYNLEGQSKWLNLLYESCFLVLFLILAWCAPTPTFLGCSVCFCRRVE